MNISEYTISFISENVQFHDEEDDGAYNSADGNDSINDNGN